MGAERGEAEERIGWEDDEAVWRLFVAVLKADHGFCDGAQHQGRDRHHEPPYNTFVFNWSRA